MLQMSVAEASRGDPIGVFGDEHAADRADVALARFGQIDGGSLVGLGGDVFAAEVRLLVGEGKAP